jgi:hypothetical protein
MDNNTLQDNQLIEKSSIWTSNPHLRMLLVVLIFVFLGCGIFLVALMQIQNQYRQKLYDDTQAALPKHQATMASSAPTVLADGRLQVDSPKDGDVIGNTFSVSGYAQGWFEGTISIKVFDASNTPLYTGNTIAGDNYDRPAPFSSEITLSATSTTLTGRIEFNDYSAKDGSLVYQKVVHIKFADVGVTGWKTYKNDQYGFEFQYPSDWTTKENINTGSAHIAVEVSKKAGTLIYPTGQDAGTVKPIEDIGSIDVYNDVKMSFADFLKNQVANLSMGSSTEFSATNAFLEKRTCELGGCQEIVYIPSYGFRLITYDYFSEETNLLIQKILSTFKFTK